MFIEVCLLSCGLYFGESVYKKIRNKTHLKSVQDIPMFINEKQKETNLSETHRYPEKTSEKKIDQNIAIASFSMGFAAIGLIYHPARLLSVPGIIYESLTFFKRSWLLIKQGKVSVDILIAITVGGCVIFGYFFMGSLAIFIHALSKKLLSKVTDDSRGKLIDVFRKAPKSVWILIDGIEIMIPFEELKIGDRLVVSTGMAIPADGTITEGIASVDQHILTGESRPVNKGIGDRVFASTFVLSGRIYITVEQAGEETNVAKIGQILNDTVEFKSEVESKSTVLAEKTVLPILMCGFISLPFLGPMSALAVINSHFKEKLTVIVPISTLNFFRIASKNAILIKDGRSLELLDRVDTIVFDKTGTLTEEQPSVGRIYRCSEYEENDILMYVSTVESKQSHPIAKAILQEAEKRKLVIPAADETDYKIGYGLTVALNSNLIHVGSSRFMKMMDISLPPEIRKAESFCHEQGCSLIMVAMDNQLIGAVELIHKVRSEMKKVIHCLQKSGKIKNMYIISGDHEAPTRQVAEKLGIACYFAETLPEEKSDIINQLKNDGKFVCYVGDGINDSIALKTSHVSVSLRGASTVATDTAQIVLLDQGLAHLGLLFDISQKYKKNTSISYAIVLTQTVLGVSGVFFLGFGLGYTVALNLTALAIGTLNSMIPMLIYSEKKHDI